MAQSNFHRHIGEMVNANIFLTFPCHSIVTTASQKRVLRLREMRQGPTQAPSGRCELPVQLICQVPGLQAVKTQISARTVEIYSTPEGLYASPGQEEAKRSLWPT